ncbi:MAG: hypothetical protein F6J93_36375 [Oscillatoria sp. SIO1A7]|nr:hypothetical protein [Oscillatoria sp. SIO1A7]
MVTNGYRRERTSQNPLNRRFFRLPKAILLTETRGANGKLAGTFPTPHTPHPTPYNLHPTPHTLHPRPWPDLGQNILACAVR